MLHLEKGIMPVPWPFHGMATCQQLLDLKRPTTRFLQQLTQSAVVNVPDRFAEGSGSGSSRLFGSDNNFMSTRQSSSLVNLSEQAISAD